VARHGDWECGAPDWPNAWSDASKRPPPLAGAPSGPKLYRRLLSVARVSAKHAYRIQQWLTGWSDPAAHRLESAITRAGATGSAGDWSSRTAGEVVAGRRDVAVQAQVHAKRPFPHRVSLP
jgi:hypothetical protein